MINKLFGPKAHRRFPRTYRLNGGGCTSDGFYPTDTDGTYEDQGVDLVFSEDSEVGETCLKEGQFRSDVLLPLLKVYHFLIVENIDSFLLVVFRRVYVILELDI